MAGDAGVGVLLVSCWSPAGLSITSNRIIMALPNVTAEEPENSCLAGHELLHKQSLLGHYETENRANGTDDGWPFAETSQSQPEPWNWPPGRIRL